MTSLQADMCVGNRLADAYLRAKEMVVEKGFAQEIASQAHLSLLSMTESDFLRECAWVVLCSGFRESIVRGIFSRLSTAFFSWQSASLIATNKNLCRERALRAFGSKRKIAAIIRIAEIVYRSGFRHIQPVLLLEPLRFIATLPMMGPATTLHLAKNLGLPLAKPDRHLVRIARAIGYSSPQHLCEDIATLVREHVSVVDLVLWRFATLHPHYLALFLSVQPLKISPGR